MDLTGAVVALSVQRDMGMDVDLNTGLQIEIEAYKVNLTTEDRQEGIRAFNEKRPPQWKGR